MIRFLVLTLLALLLSGCYIRSVPEPGHVIAPQTKISVNDNINKQFNFD